MQQVKTRSKPPLTSVRSVNYDNRRGDVKNGPKELERGAEKTSPQFAHEDASPFQGSGGLVHVTLPRALTRHLHETDFWPRQLRSNAIGSNSSPRTSRCGTPSHRSSKAAYTRRKSTA